MLHAQADVAQQPDDVVGRVNGHLLRADHADAGVGKHAHQVLDGVLIGNRVPALDDANLALGLGQKGVDRARLALAPRLLNQPDALVPRHKFARNRHRLVRAGAGDHDDLADFHVVQVLIEQRLQQRANVLLFVVDRHADGAAEGSGRIAIWHKGSA